MIPEILEVLQKLFRTPVALELQLKPCQRLTFTAYYNHTDQLQMTSYAS